MPGVKHSQRDMIGSAWRETSERGPMAPKRPSYARCTLTTLCETHTVPDGRAIASFNGTTCIPHWNAPYELTNRQVRIRIIILPTGNIPTHNDSRASTSLSTTHLQELHYGYSVPDRVDSLHTAATIQQQLPRDSRRVNLSRYALLSDSRLLRQHLPVNRTPCWRKRDSPRTSLHRSLQASRLSRLAHRGRAAARYRASPLRRPVTSLANAA